MPDENCTADVQRYPGMTHAESGRVLGVSVRTVKRRVEQCLRLLTARLGDLGPDDTPPA